MTTTDTNHVSINSLPWHTATEIVQQPWVWEKTYHLIKERKKRNSGISDTSLCGRETGNNTHRGWQFGLYR
ncbi:MAG: hypothetical protein WC151_06165 [Bacteroidales bacterium]